MSRRWRVLKTSLHGLSRNRVRTFFMVASTFAGVCALVVITAIGRGTQRDVLDRLDQMLSGSTILLRAGGSQVRAGAHSGGMPVSTTTTLTLRDLHVVDSLLAAVEQVDPMLMTRREVQYAGRSREVLIEGHSEIAEQVWNRTAARGTFLSAQDVASSARVALVGEVVVEELFGGRDPIGEQIRIGAVPFQVIGVLEPGGMDPHGIDKDDMIMIPITTMMRRVMNVDYVGFAKLGLTPDTDLDMAVLDIADILRREHALGPGEPNDFSMFTPVQVQQVVREAGRTFTVVLPLIAALSVFVGGLVVANLMLMTVNDRRGEIGLRKAIGARANDIRLQFLVESAVVTLVGGMIAVVTAFGIVQGLAMHGLASTTMPWAAGALGVATSLVVGIAAGVMPARRAAALDPVHTLR